MNRWTRRLLGIFLSVVLGATQALAVALGGIEVASHLGEPFHAEVPLNLAKGERISGVFVELASPSDYRILEIYRDPALNAIRADIKSDERGARVELTSDSPIEAPFFNLVLKVRHGHATHFKKFPVFLDLPRARPASAKPLPTVSAVKPQGQPGGEIEAEGGAAAVAPEEQSKEATAPAFKPYDGWARIGRYGPMVYGDTISTVAKRLRIDDRYTMAQVMMALFYKNRSKFDHDNVNLIKAGVYLDVPKASEVEAISPARARRLLAEHNRVWTQLKRQPRYAAVAEAQKNRYKARVRIGKAASGVAAAPVREEASAAKGGTGKAGPENAPAAGPAVKGDAGPAGKPTAGREAAAGAAAARVKELERKNAELQQKLKETEARMEAMSARVASTDVAAANARIKKLELRLARLQAELDRQKQAREAAAGAPGWMVYGLGGLVVALLAVVGWLLSRMRRMSVPAVAAPAPAAGEAPVAAAPEAGDFEEVVQEFEEVGDGELEATAGEATDESTRQMSADEYGDAFTDSVPDLTESDTAEMEPFQEAVEEEPDPNVDYLAEADVYLRYGMEEEALRQIRLAIKQRPDNAEAHARLVQALKASGDEAAAGEAMTAARESLSGEALQAFEDALAEGVGESEGSEEVDLGDTLPPTGVEALDFGETGGEAAETAEPEAEQETLVLGEEAGGEETETLTDIDLELGEAVEATTEEEAAEAPTLTEEVKLPEEATIGHEEPEVAREEQPAEESSAAAETEQAEGKVETDAEGVLDMTEVDMGELDWDAATTLEETAQETVVESPAGEAEEAADTEGPETHAPEAKPAATGADLDLSDFEMPEVEAEDEAADAPSVGIETSDLEKTVAIDWSGDTEALEELTAGLDSGGAAEQEAEESVAGGEEQEGAEASGDQAGTAQETGEAVTSSGVLDIGLDEIDMEAAEASSADVEMDDFTSTVQLTVETRAEDKPEDIGLESVELEALPELDADVGEMTLSDAASAVSDGEEDSDVASGEDAGTEIPPSDISNELDTLLMELDLGSDSPSPDNLDADRAKSLLSEAEAAIEQGDAARARELLGEAEGVVAEADRKRFETLKRKVDEN